MLKSYENKQIREWNLLPEKLSLLPKHLRDYLNRSDFSPRGVYAYGIPLDRFNRDELMRLIISLGCPEEMEGQR